MNNFDQMHFLPYILTPKHTSCLRCNSMLRISTACVTSITMNNRGQIITECNSHSSGPLLWLCSLLYFSEKHTHLTMKIHSKVQSCTNRVNCMLSCFSHVHLCPLDSPGKTTGVGCHALLQGESSQPRDWTPVSWVFCIGR